MINKLLPENLEAAEKHFKKFLIELGFDPDNDPHMKDTPKRVVKLYTQELFKGEYNEPPEITTFGRRNEYYDQMIFSGPINVRSTCSHHFLPIVGHAFVGILLHEESPLPGLSKYARVVHHFASMPQVQERLTKQVAGFLQEKLKPQGVGVLVRAKHFCQCHRGVHENDALMVTTELTGLFKSPSLKDEFLQTIRLCDQVK
jgi:GTP cyclohydrolase I